MKKFNEFNKINEDDDNYSGIMSTHFQGDDDFGTSDPDKIRVDREFEERKEESIKRTHLYDSKNLRFEIMWDDLELDMKRDFGEFTNIRTDDFRYVFEWLKNKISGKKIL